MLSHRKRKPLAARAGSWIPELDTQPAYSVMAQPILVEGDLVSHITFDYLNEGRPLQVLDTNRTEALCHYTEGPQQTPVLTWYLISQLVLVHSAKDSDNTAE
ncbi:MAG: hypothetical protein EOO61_20925 [Hymenobacter sp.]|nr:MAG: hypothetical protein EOO61_20925 [Hymenobacter sp.]